MIKGGPTVVVEVERVAAVAAVGVEMGDAMVAEEETDFNVLKLSNWADWESTSCFPPSPRKVSDSNCVMSSEDSLITCEAWWIFWSWSRKSVGGGAKYSRENDMSLFVTGRSGYLCDKKGVVNAWVNVNLTAPRNGRIKIGVVAAVIDFIMMIKKDLSSYVHLVRGMEEGDGKRLALTN